MELLTSFSKISSGRNTSLLTAGDVCLEFGFFDLSLKLIPLINSCIDLRLFSKFLVDPFLRPLRVNVEF